MASRGQAGSSQRQGMEVHTVWAVAALLMLVVISMIAGVGYVIWQERNNTVRRIEERAANAVHTAEEHVRWMIEAARQALTRVEDALAANPHSLSKGKVRDLQATVRALPDSTFIWVFDAQGDTVLASDNQNVSINVADREYFKALANGAEWHISPLLTERAGGRKVFTVGRRLEHAGLFAGVAIVAIPADLMSDFYRTLDLGPRSSVSLVRDDGWLVARHPQLRETMNLSNYVLFTKYLKAAPSGVYHAERSPADGEARVVAYRRVQGLPLISIIGVSKTAAFELLWLRLRVLGVVAAGLLIVLLLLSGWVIALLRRDERVRRILRRSLEQNEMLLREVHHRVKNNLQIVSSLVQLQPGSPESKAEMTRRIGAMAAVHEQIYRTDQFSAIDLADYIQVVCTSLGETFGKAVQMRFELDPLEAHIDIALPLGLLVSEVVSNALKHAFPTDRVGAITIVLERHGEHEAMLRISDDGIGFDPAKPATGLGMRLLQAFADQVSGRYRFESKDGTSFILFFPLQREPQHVSIVNTAPAPTPAAS